LLPLRRPAGHASAATERSTDPGDERIDDRLFGLISACVSQYNPITVT
jgi:hypothetical protein